MTKTPILFICFNRPDIFHKCIKNLINNQNKENKKREIYVAIDGPRLEYPNDKKLIEKCFTIAKKFTKKKNILLRKKNLGCQISVNQAIDWFFSKEEKGIIVEDDCLLDKKFLDICDIYLEKFNDEKDLYGICATGDYLPKNKNDVSEINLFLTRFPTMWGWATWKNKWNLNQQNMDSWKSLNFIDKFLLLPGGFLTKLSIYNVFTKHSVGFLDTWDYDWIKTVFMNNGYFLRSDLSLCKNIGFEGTHYMPSDDERFKSKLPDKNIKIRKKVYKYSELNFNNNSELKVSKLYFSVKKRRIAKIIISLVYMHFFKKLFRIDNPK